jgi:hypothetical protein
VADALKSALRNAFTLDSFVQGLIWLALPSGFGGLLSGATWLFTNLGVGPILTLGIAGALFVIGLRLDLRAFHDERTAREQQEHPSRPSKASSANPTGPSTASTTSEEWPSVATHGVFSGGGSLALNEAPRPLSVSFVGPVTCAVRDPRGVTTNATAYGFLSVQGGHEFNLRYPDDFPGAPETPLPAGKYFVTWQRGGGLLMAKWVTRDVFEIYAKD